jgi:hypothetical protein
MEGKVHYRVDKSPPLVSILSHPIHVCLRLSVGHLIADGPRQHSKSWLIFLFFTSLLHVLKWSLFFDERRGPATTGASRSSTLFAAVELLKNIVCSVRLVTPVTCSNSRVGAPHRDKTNTRLDMGSLYIICLSNFINNMRLLLLLIMSS